jgi:hypothetical protein
VYTGLFRVSAVAIALLGCLPPPVTAQSALSGDTIHVTRATGPIAVDGDLSDEAWRHSTRVDKWYETNPGDNVEPQVKNVGYLTYDDHFFTQGSSSTILT